MMDSSKNTVRNECPTGLSWLIRLVGQGGFTGLLAFLRISLLSLCYASINKDNLWRLRNHTPQGFGTSIRYPGVFLFTISSHGANLSRGSGNYFLHKSSVAFFMATPSPLSYGIPGRQRIAQTLNSINLLDQAGLLQLKMWRGFGGCAGIALLLFHSKTLRQ